jgi:ADP-heptose:LPS heptosyltransferase
MGARWIVAFDGDTPGYKNWMVDEFVPVPAWPWNWGDASALLLPGPAPAAFDPADWPEPPCAAFDAPAARYAVFHLGARNPLRHWQAPKWRALAEWAVARGLHASFAGRLDLAQLWHLVKRASLVVCPDTGIAHLARLTGAPCVTLFGPGSVTLSGAGAYWGQGPTRAVSVADVPCRNQSVVFRRHVPGMQRCVRFAPDCTDNVCMQGLSIAAVTEAAEGVLRQASN